MLLMFPVPRSTFLHWLTGTSFPTLIKYHRYEQLILITKPLHYISKTSTAVFT